MLHVPGFECNACKQIIFPDDLVTGCSSCDFFYHKNCTDLKHFHQDHDKAKTWKCDHCAPKLPEKDMIRICHLCNSEAPNSTSLETHMLNNHCPNIAAQCELCDKRFEQEESFLLHVKFAHNNDTTIKCEACEITIRPKDLSLTCDSCHFLFHKKCTELRKAGGHWKPSNWNCHFCRSNTLDNGNAKNISETVDDSRIIVKPSTKHKKSNVNNESPEKEFLLSQINTLKSI